METCERYLLRFRDRQMVVPLCFFLFVFRSPGPPSPKAHSAGQSSESFVSLARRGMASATTIRAEYIELRGWRKHDCCETVCDVVHGEQKSHLYVKASILTLKQTSTLFQTASSPHQSVLSNIFVPSGAVAQVPRASRAALLDADGELLQVLVVRHVVLHGLPDHLGASLAVLGGPLFVELFVRFDLLWLVIYTLACGLPPEFARIERRGEF